MQSERFAVARVYKRATATPALSVVPQPTLTGRARFRRCIVVECEPARIVRRLIERHRGGKELVAAKCVHDNGVAGTTPRKLARELRNAILRNADADLTETLPKRAHDSVK